MRSYVLILAAAIAVAVAGCGGGSSPGSDSSGENEQLTDSTPIRTEVVVASDFQGTAMLGEPYEGEMSVVAVDARNTITSLKVENQTAGGAQPSINAAGNLVWTPNAADFATRSLTVKVVSAHGGETTLTMPARVGRKEIIHRIPIDDGEGVYTDPDGDFRIRVTKVDAAQPVSGTIIVQRIIINIGGAGFEYSLEGVGNASLDVVDEPIEFQSSGENLTTQSDSEEIAFWSDTKLTWGVLNLEISRNPGSFIDPWVEKNLWTTRLSMKKSSGAKAKKFDWWWIGGTAGSCNSTWTCRAEKYTKPPVVLIHGFTPGSLGGGEGTWGELPRSLVESGHPVFEVRWRTYMRFEEAAWILQQTVEEAAQLTGKKAIVVGHSFGGIVAHLAAQGKAEAFFGDDQQWHQTSTDQIAKVITINSPLSGITKSPIKVDGFDLTAGRDGNDRTIAACKAVTCLQAGEFISMDDSLAFLGLNASNLPKQGSAIKKLKASQTPVPFHVIVGLTEGIDTAIKVNNCNGGIACDTTLDLIDFYNPDLGDGLIGLLGQSWSPSDFVDNPYRVGFKVVTRRFGAPIDMISVVGSSLPLLTRSRVDEFNSTSFGKCLKHVVGGVDYRICRRSAHTNGAVFGHRQGNYADFGSAYYMKDPDDFGPRVNHPLHDLLIDSGSSDYLLGAAINSCDANANSLVCRPSLKAKGQVNFGSTSIVTQSSAPAPSVLVWLTYEHKTTGALVRDFSAQTAADGSFEVDIGTPLRERAGLDAAIADYRLKVVIWGGTAYQTYRETLEDLVEGDNQLAPITLLPKQAALVNITGRVIDGQTSNTGIASATVRLALGADLDANTIRAHTDVRSVNNTNTARLITTTPDGSFSTQGLRAGIYSILVSKAGYFDQLQGRVTVTSNGNISLSMLKVLPAGENSVTLRWDNGSVGAAVARDLDSHMLRLGGGAVDYHIYFGRRTIAGLNDSLDRDDTDFEGPETVTFSSATGKDFVYYVHNWSGGATSIVDSRARVTLRYAGRTLQFSPPTTGNLNALYWRVFDIVNGSIVRCVSNCLQDAAPSGLATQGAYAEIPALWRSTLTQLPTKH